MIRTRTVALLLALPLALTACGGGDTEPEPTPTVTVTASPKVITETETEYVTETADRMPQECAEAFAAAGRVMEAVSPMLTTSADLAALVPEAYDAGFTEAATGNTSKSEAVAAEASRIVDVTEGQSNALTEATAAADAALDACTAATQ